jgi:hypothetical protein
MSATQRADVVAGKLGEDLARDKGALGTLLPELVSGRGRLPPLGAGLARATDDLHRTWNALVGQWELTPEENRNAQLLRGFLSAAHEKNSLVAGELLDQCLEHKALARWFPELQTSVPIDEAGVERLKRALAIGKAAVEAFRCLAWGRASEPIPGADLKELLVSIGTQPGGHGVAVEILSMRLHGDRDNKRSHAPEILSAGRQLLGQMLFDERNDREDCALGRIARACLVGNDGSVLAQEIMARLRDAVSKLETSPHSHNDLLKGMLKLQTGAVLDALFAGSNDKERRQGVRFLDQLRDVDGKILDGVGDEKVLDWCEREPEIRYPLAAAVVSVFEGPDVRGRRNWTKVALSLLERTPDKARVLREFSRRLRPMSWSGSRAALMEANARLLDDLEDHPDPEVVRLVGVERSQLVMEIEGERRYESAHDQETDERFE